MREFTLRYLKHGQPIPGGWELVADFDDCHHGRYSQGIIQKIEPESPKLCPFCAEPLKEEQMHGHYVCLSCKQITSGCCGDGDIPR